MSHELIIVGGGPAGILEISTGQKRSDILSA